MATNKQYFSELIGKTFSKKNLIFVWIVFSVLFLSGCNGAGGTPGANGGWQDIVIQVVHGLMQIVWALLWVLTALVTILTHPGWYNGEFFGMQGYFKDIWILVSNVVYFAFAFILIRLAFMNIIGKGEGDFELKQALPRFVIGILIVPFSWFFVQFILSLSSILMVALMSLPEDVFKDKQLFDNNKQMVCTSFTLNLWSPISWAVGNGWAWSAWGEVFKCDKSSEKELGQLFKSDKWIYSIVGAYTYGILKLDGLNKLNADLWVNGTIKTVTNLAIKTIFDLLFIIVYFVLMMALFIALLVRGVQIWLYIMFSPIFWLQYFFKKEDAGELDSFNFMEFVKVAFVPALVGAALSFGLVFILVINQGMMKPSPTSTSNMVTCKDGNKVCTIEVWEFKFAVEWAVGQWVWFVNEGAQIWLGALGTIMMNLFGLAVLWMAVMTALTSGGKMVNQVIEPIHSFGKEMWKLAMTSPQYLPILPGGLSAHGLPQVWSTIKSSIQDVSNKRARDFEASLWLNPQHTELLQKIDKWINKLSNWITNNRDLTAVNDLKSFTTGLWTWDKLKKETRIHNYIRQMWITAWVDKTKVEWWNFSSEQDFVNALKAIKEWPSAWEWKKWLPTTFDTTTVWNFLLKWEVDWPVSAQNITQWVATNPVTVNFWPTPTTIQVTTDTTTPWQTVFKEGIVEIVTKKADNSLVNIQPLVDFIQTKAWTAKISDAELDTILTKVIWWTFLNPDLTKLKTELKAKWVLN